MTEHTDLSNLPRAAVDPQKRPGLSIVWVVPIVAALVGLAIVVQKYRNEGPKITLTFRSAGGIEAGKTAIKYKDIEIGKVTAVTLSDDYNRILVTAQMVKQVERLLVDDARFWLVEPRVTLSGVSGIGTLVSGNYIGFEPGKSGKKRRDFAGLDVPPPVTTGLPGRELSLRSDTLGSLGIGSPVYFRHLNVGQVIAYDLSPDANSVQIKVFLNAPYDGYVTQDTRFWEVSGVDVSVGAGGVAVRTESVVSLLVGGVAFETPPSAEPGEAVDANTVFTLFRDRTAALAPAEAQVSRFALSFSESIRGLSVGAPLLFLGLPVGEVTAIGLDMLPEDEGFRTRVEFAVRRDLLLAHLEKSGAATVKAAAAKQADDFVDRQVRDKGLRAQLRSGSLISGQLLVALDYFPDAPKARIDWSQKPPRMPAVPGDLEELEAKVKNILAKLEKVPLEEIGSDVRKTLRTLDRTLANADRTLSQVNEETLPEVKKTLAALEQTLKDAGGAIEEGRHTLSRVDEETLPEVKMTLEELRKTISAAERVLANTDKTFLGPDAPAQQELREAMQEIARASRALRALADYLERNPSSLIRGRNQEKP